MKKNAILIFGLLFFVAGCATSVNGSTDTDRFESVNRKIFSFNYRFDKYVLKPLAQGYIKITTKDIRVRISSIFNNILEPISAANHLLQGEFKAAGTNLGRFVVNTTLGLGGSFDVATGWGWTPNKSGFDDTLARWCVADGPYIVLPFFGPSTPRSAVGLIADSASNPVYISVNSIHNDGQANTIRYSYSGLRAISLRADSMALLDDLEKNSVDFYAAMRSAYMQNRSSKNCYIKSETNTYDFDFSADEEDQTYQEMEQK